MLEVSSFGVEFIKLWERFRAQAYPDAAGVPTIGYGTTRINGVPVKLGMTISEPDATRELMLECQAIAPQLESAIVVALNQNQVDAIISFCYNVGVGGFVGSSLRAAINSGADIPEDLFTRWNKIRDPRTGQLVVLDGLTKRRRYEYLLFSAPPFQVRFRS